MVSGKRRVNTAHYIDWERLRRACSWIGLILFIFARMESQAFPINYRIGYSNSSRCKFHDQT